MGIDKIKIILENLKNGHVLELKTPFIAASGTYGYCDEYLDFIDLDYFGAISTKGITLEKRPGNSGERIFEVKNGMINRIGLENIGIESFIKDKLPILNEKNIDFLLNIAGSATEDYIKLAQIADDNKIKAIEVNVSCPNVKKGCLEFGTNPNSLFELIKNIRNNYSGFLIVKLSPNVDNIKALACAIESGGADCISAINTLHGLGVKIDFINGKFNKTMVQGGLSGNCIKPVALYMINQIKQAVNIPIIAMGGIEKLEDIFEFMSVGADAFQIGTANFINPSICVDLAKELNNFLDKNNIKDITELKKELKDE